VSLVTEAGSDDGTGMNFSRYAAAGCAAMILGGVLPAVASATDYCVGTAGCTQGNTFGSLDAALDKADDQPDSDRVLIGPGQQLANAITGFSYARPDAPVEIVGAGVGKTVLTSKLGGSGNVLFLSGGSGTSIHDLTIRIPEDVAPGDFRGLTTKNVARHISVWDEPTQSESVEGVLLANGGQLEDSVLTLTSKKSGGVRTVSSLAGAPPNVVRGSKVSAVNTGITFKGIDRVEGSVVTARGLGIWAEGDSSIESSVVRVTQTNGSGIYSVPTPTGTTVRVDGSTIVEPGQAGEDGIVANTDPNPLQDIHIDVANSVIGAADPLVPVATGKGRVLFNTSYSAYDRTGLPVSGSGGAWDVTENAVTDVKDFGFVDAASGDVHLRADSPLVDAGDPATPQGLDLDGNPLVADGNADGTATRDIGAYELQPAPGGGEGGPGADTLPPVISGFRAARTRLSYRLSESARVTVRIQRRLGGRRARYRTLGKVAASARTGPNRTRVGARLRRRDARPGRYRAVIVAVDAAGNRSAAKTATFRVSR
jgi:hypothetical protein